MTPVFSQRGEMIMERKKNKNIENPTPKLLFEQFMQQDKYRPADTAALRAKGHNGGLLAKLKSGIVKAVDETAGKHYLHGRGGKERDKRDGRRILFPYRQITTKRDRIETPCKSLQV